MGSASENVKDNKTTVKKVINILN